MTQTSKDCYVRKKVSQPFSHSQRSICAGRTTIRKHRGVRVSKQMDKVDNLKIVKSPLATADGQIGNLSAALRQWDRMAASVANPYRGERRMNAVGIDVSKNKSMVTVARPFGQVVVKPFEVRHTAIELRKLANFLEKQSRYATLC